MYKHTTVSLPLTALSHWRTESWRIDRDVELDLNGPAMAFGNPVLAANRDVVRGSSGHGVRPPGDARSRSSPPRKHDCRDQHQRHDPHKTAPCSSHHCPELLCTPRPTRSVPSQARRRLSASRDAIPCGSRVGQISRKRQRVLSDAPNVPARPPRTLPATRWPDSPSTLDLRQDSGTRSRVRSLGNRDHPTFPYGLDGEPSTCRRLDGSCYTEIW